MGRAIAHAPTMHACAHCVHLAACGAHRPWSSTTQALAGDATALITYENSLGTIARSLRRVMDAQAAKARATAVAHFARSDVAQALVQETRGALVDTLQRAFEASDKDGTGMIAGVVSDAHAAV